MSKQGMSMPGGGRPPAAPMDVYTVLFGLATILLATAAAVLWINGAKIAPDGQPWKLQSDRVSLSR